MNRGPWGGKADDNLSEEEVNYANSSTARPKRSLQWFGDDTEAGLFSSKKQALETPSANSFSEILNSTIQPWGQNSCFQPIPGHFNERFFDPASRIACPDNRNSSLVNLDRLGVGSKMDEPLFINTSSSGLSMGYCLDPEMETNYGGLRKVKVNQVKEANGLARASLELGYSSVYSKRHPLDPTESINMPLGLDYSKENERIMSSVGTAESENSIFVPTGQSYGRMSESMSLCEPYEQNQSILGMMQTFSKCDTNSLGAPPFSKIEEKSMAMEHSYLNSDNSNANIGRNRRGESTIISFGGYEDNDSNFSGRLLSTYELFASQPAFQISEADHESQMVDPNLGSYGMELTSAAANNISKRKDDIKTSKKASTNSFPSNVRSLLSTGMLDGVSVKYIAWSREKELCGVIKGSGYLCGCQSCNFAKVVNAYEFERHANCKTKHPNNHIYFENGKTIYGIVQELRSTPQNMLFDVMQTITGSPINQKSFRLWKESFQAAARELQRIYEILHDQYRKDEIMLDLHLMLSHWSLVGRKVVFNQHSAFKAYGPSNVIS